MDLPQPPADIDLKNIIDKLAQFVARNGPEFEQMTKNKQKDNPKFSFLFGGELFNYYQYKVTTEQAILKLKSAAAVAQNNSVIQQSHLQGILNASNNAIPNRSNPPASSGWQQQPNVSSIPNAATLTSIAEQQNVLQQQITQSEQNLAAQHSSLMLSQDTIIEETIRKFQLEKLTQKAIETGLNLTELDNVLQPIIDSCTKDSISTGKAWILNHTTRGSHDVIAEYLMIKVISFGVSFTQKLHIIYLVNDVMHHCVRKNSEVLKRALENVVVPMFCHSWICGTPEQQEKLRKLLNLWEAKNNYFSSEVIQKMMKPEESWALFQEDRNSKHEEIIAPTKMSTNASYDSYRSQHDLFVNHAISQIQTLEKEKMEIERQQQEAQNQIKLQMQGMQPPMPSMMPDDMRPMSYSTPPPNILPPGGQFMQPPPDFSHLPPELLPDFSRPPPGFEPEPQIEEVIPTVPYYELPAGLMVNMVKVDDFEYKPLDPSKLRLPPAVPPSERLMQAVEAFYQKTYTGNTRERLILDADGWEKLGLYEYYKEKNAARKKKEMEIEAGMRDRSRSTSPIRRERSRSRSPKKKRCYKSKSPTPDKTEKARSRSKSKTPPRRSSGRKSPRRAKRRSRSKSVSPPSRARSPTPPSFGNFSIPLEEKLDESNKGHQMLRKMGWGGAGLGSNEQGIADPISGGDIRDKVDQYKGVGVNLHDPYESFRKNKGKAFIVRMKARAEERAGTD